MDPMLWPGRRLVVSGGQPMQASHFSDGQTKRVATPPYTRQELLRPSTLRASYQDGLLFEISTNTRHSHSSWTLEGCYVGAPSADQSETRFWDELLSTTRAGNDAKLSEPLRWSITRSGGGYTRFGTEGWSGFCSHVTRGLIRWYFP